jgi:hypothetical protein
MGLLLVASTMAASKFWLSVGCVNHTDFYDVFFGRAVLVTLTAIDQPSLLTLILISMILVTTVASVPLVALNV